MPPVHLAQCKISTFVDDGVVNFVGRTGLRVDIHLFYFIVMDDKFLKELSKVSDAVAEDLLYERLEASIPVADPNEVDYDFLSKRWREGSGDYFVL